MQNSSQNVATNKATPSFLQAGCPSCHPTNSVKALKGNIFQNASINQSINQPTNQPTNQSIHPSIHPSISPSVHQSVNQSVNQSINQSIMHHSTEARATMSLSQTEKERLKSVLENVNGWSSPTVQWKRVPESWCRDI